MVWWGEMWLWPYLGGWVGVLELYNTGLDEVVVVSLRW